MRKFAELRARMSQESQQRARSRTAEMLATLFCRCQDWMTIDGKRCERCGKPIQSDTASGAQEEK